MFATFYYNFCFCVLFPQRIFLVFMPFVSDIFGLETVFFFQECMFPIFIYSRNVSKHDYTLSFLHNFLFWKAYFCCVWDTFMFFFFWWEKCVNDWKKSKAHPAATISQKRPKSGQKVANVAEKQQKQPNVGKSGEKCQKWPKVV